MAKRQRDIEGQKDVNARGKEEARLALAAIDARNSLSTYEDMDEIEAAKKIKAVLLSIAFNEGAMESSRIAAIDKWMDRVMGKAVQMNVVHVSDGDRMRRAMDMVRDRERELGLCDD